MLKTIKQFIKDYKKYMFKYRKGFYVLPVLINSPITAIESFKRTPFIKWDSSKNKLSLNNMFAKGETYYIEISDGLWFYASEMYSKVNLEFVGYFNDKEPMEYYSFGYNLIKQNNSKKFALNSGLSYSSGSWNFFKPNHKLHHIVFKETNIQLAGLYMSRNWLNKNIISNNKYPNRKLNLFINSKSTFKLLPDPNLNNKFIDNALNIAQISDVNIRKRELKKFANETIDYILNSKNLAFDENLIDADPDMLIKLTKVEKCLKDNLLTEFPGIEVLASDINISPAKLKVDFKNYFGEPIYQYYLNKRLVFAHELLTNHNKTVGETAEILGYKNVGKFAVAFKNKFAVLPSKIKDRDQKE